MQNRRQLIYISSFLFKFCEIIGIQKYTCYEMNNNRYLALDAHVARENQRIITRFDYIIKIPLVLEKGRTNSVQKSKNSVRMELVQTYYLLITY